MCVRGGGVRELDIKGTLVRGSLSSNDVLSEVLSCAIVDGALYVEPFVAFSKSGELRDEAKGYRTRAQE